MHIKALEITHYRGLTDFRLAPQGHVILLGPPGVGRTDILNALTRVLDPDGLNVPASELDFHNRDTSLPVGIEVTLGGLSAAITQEFFEHLELWDIAEDRLIDQADPLDVVDEESQEFVLRIAYRAQWLDEEERPEERRYFPKTSDPASGIYTGVRRTELAMLPFSRVRWNSGSLLGLSGRGAFRLAVEGAPGNDFSDAVASYLARVSEAASDFGQSEQLTAALDAVLQPIRLPLRKADEASNEIVKFSPEGGSESGLLRSLHPALMLREEAGFLPVQRQGRAAQALLRTGEALAPIDDVNGVLAIDDLGDGLDPASTVHLASVIRERVEQAWITTRVSEAAEVFDPSHLFRIAENKDHMVRAWRRSTPNTRAERVAARHSNRSVIAALSYRAVMIVEGPDDLVAFTTLARRRWLDARVPLPASDGLAIIPSGGGGDGGASMVAKAGRAARDMGLFCIGVIDGDRGGNPAEVVAQVAGSVDRVIRLPDSVAIERALVDGVPVEALRHALREVAQSSDAPPIHGLAELEEGALRRAASKYLKDHGGLHGHYVEALEAGIVPPIACRVLDEAIASVTEHRTGIYQLP